LAELIAYIFVIIGQSGSQEKRIKEQAACSAVPQSKAQPQDYHRLHPAFTMMLSKPLVSFIAAFAVATGASAASTPMARDGQCNVGTVSCCNATLGQSNPLMGLLAGILGVDLGLNTLLGLQCIDILSTVQW